MDRPVGPEAIGRLRGALSGAPLGRCCRQAPKRNLGEHRVGSHAARRRQSLVQGFRRLRLVPDPLRPSTGLGVLHLFVRFTQGTDPEALLSAVKSATEDGNQVVTVAVLGHKADLCLMALGPEMWSLQRFQAAVRSSGAELVWSYISLTELSEYAEGLPEEMKQARLFPNLPPEGKPAFCFYPMSKRRTAADNWYSLEFEERKALMMGHGAVGRLFRGRILQLITGSTGLDDWEWGVTLFGVHPDDLKQCVYEMRFDVASARFAEFGPFVTGMVTDPSEIISGLSAARGSK
jgi:hydrogen peroxide-dependent heme synthase